MRFLEYSSRYGRHKSGLISTKHPEVTLNEHLGKRIPDSGKSANNFPNFLNGEGI